MYPVYWHRLISDDSCIYNPPTIMLQYYASYCTSSSEVATVETLVKLVEGESPTPKSITSSFVSSVPLRLPTAHTSVVSVERIRHTTPPLPRLSNVTRLRTNSPVLTSHNFTVPSSLDVMTNLLLNCNDVTALWCLLGPASRTYDVHC